MSYYIIIRGPLGSGKTALSQALAKSLNAEHIAIDEILDKYNLTTDKEDGYISRKSFLKANEVASRNAIAFLEAGTPVIFDGNFYWRSQIEDLIQKLDYSNHIFTLKVPLEICVERDSKRDNPHGSDATEVVYNKTTEFSYGIEIDAIKSIDEIIKDILNEIQKGELREKVRHVVSRAFELKNKYTNEKDAPVNYACIFSQSKDEYDTLITLAKKIGTTVKETSTGVLFQIQPLQTIAGTLQLLKIRIPDSTRPERGDADFTISDFPIFEQKYLKRSGFKRIEKENFYMVELMDPDFDVRAYFSNPPLDKQLNISYQKNKPM